VPFVSLQGFSTSNGNLSANLLVSVPGAAAQTVSTPVSILSQQRVRGCQVLNLQLGAVHLDVLGLKVDLQPLTLKVQAIPGRGQLLGNLLCGPGLHGQRLLNNLVGDLNALVEAGNRLAGLTAPASPLGSTTALDVQGLSNALTNAGITAGTASCPVLTLTTGPIDLNLLGLDVSVPTGVNLTVTAVPSSQPGGGVLGDLLCQLSKALDNPGALAGKLSGLNLSNLLSSLVAPVLGGTTPGAPGGTGSILGALGGLTHGLRRGAGLGRAATAAPGATSILSLTVGAINLNLLGLQVKTSPICLNVTAQRGPGDLLGNLLTGLLGQRGLSLGGLLRGLDNLVNSLGGLSGALGPTNSTGLTSPALLQRVLGDLAAGLATTTNPTASCPVLHLVLGPLHLDLLGLVVDLNNCANGPVTVDVTAIPGAGNLLGNLLCDLTNLVGAPA
jgi:hypothetical protein